MINPKTNRIIDSAMDRSTKVTKYSLIDNPIYAFVGILTALRSEYNLWIQTAIGVCSVAYFLYMDQTNYAIINLIMMFIVGSLELVNTAFEKLCDLVDRNYNEDIKKIKDIAAGAVLYTALGWLVLLVYCFVMTIINMR